MGVAVTLRTVEPSPTAVVPATTTWTEFPRLWGVLLDQVWAFLRSDDAPVGLWTSGHNIMLYKDDVPNVEVGVQVSGSFDPAGHVVPSALPGGLAATATHTGPIAEISHVAEQFVGWLDGHRFRRTLAVGLLREVRDGQG